jgi:hypothetical protein
MLPFLYKRRPALVTVDLPLEKLDVRLFHPVLLRLMTGSANGPEKAQSPWCTLVEKLHQSAANFKGDLRVRRAPKVEYFLDLFAPSTISSFTQFLATVDSDPNLPLPSPSLYRPFAFKAFQFLFWSVNNIVHTSWLPAADVTGEVFGLSRRGLCRPFRSSGTCYQCMGSDSFGSLCDA